MMTTAPVPTHIVKEIPPQVKVSLGRVAKSVVHTLRRGKTTTAS